MANLQDEINRLFDDSITETGGSDDDLSTCAWRPAVDVYETPDGVAIKAELPGISRENVSVELKGNVLTITGERPADNAAAGKDYYRQERCFGSFHRSFTLRDVIDPEKIKAKIKDGILEIEIIRPEEEQPRHIKVDIA
jgi:HSP20 family protein